MEDKLTSGISSILEIAKNKMKGIDQYVPEEVRLNRMSICSECPSRKDRFGGQCGECLCVISLKTKFKQEECPLKKWTKYEEEVSNETNK